MFDKLATEEQRYEELMRLLGTSEVQSEPAEYRKHAKALAEVEPLIQKFREYKALVRDIAETEELAAAGDPDMRDLAREEVKSLVVRREALIGEMKILLIPKDPNDEKNVMLEIRAGTGGDEAALFAGELFRMYSRYAERQGWRLELMSMSESRQRFRNDGRARAWLCITGSAGSKWVKPALPSRPVRRIEATRTRRAGTQSSASSR